MLKRQSRHLALLLVLAMLATLFVGVGVAQAKSLNSVNKVLSVADGYKEASSGVVLTLKEDSDFVDHFVTGDVFELSLPTGVKWNDVDGMQDEIDAGTNNATVKKVSSSVVEVKMGTMASTQDTISIPLSFEIDGATGTVAVTVVPLDSGVSGGDYNFAVVAEGNMSASVDSVKKIARNSSNKAGTIQLRETSVSAVAYGQVKVVVKLPGNFSWIEGSGQTSVSFSGGFTGCSASTFAADGRELTLIFNAPENRTQRGTIYITPYINPGRSAAFGEVEVGIKATDQSGFSHTLFDGDLVIAEYVDWGIKAKVKDVEELLAGKFNQKTAEITLEEGVAGTLLANRDLTVELPDWVKITDFSKLTGTTMSIGTPDLGDLDQNYVDIPITAGSTSTAGKIKFKLTLSMDGAKSGDIEAKIFGAGVDETSLVIATALAPAIATVDRVDEVKIGVQNQPIADITITEGKKGAFFKPYVKKYDGTTETANARVLLTLTEGARFASTPTVTVTDGNLEISTANVRRVSDDTQVEIPLKSEGTKLSTIKVSNIKLTLNRTIPEGDLLVRVGGYAVIENTRSVNGNDVIDEGEFATGNVVSLVAAKVVTPADANVYATATFVIGNTVYQINGVDQAAMDQAPYLKNDRTYLPVRFVAYGLGIGDNGIIWDEINRTVTLMKGDKVVQLKIGSTDLLVNGASIAMDAAPEITAAGRTCLPIRFVAEAFGAVVGWDAATQTVTITL